MWHKYVLAQVKKKKYSNPSFKDGSAYKLQYLTVCVSKNIDVVFTPP